MDLCRLLFGGGGFRVPGSGFRVPGVGDETRDVALLSLGVRA